MPTSLLQYAVRKVAGCLDQDQAGAFLLAALDDPVGALREARDHVPADVAELAQTAADSEVRRQIARRIRTVGRS